jgi:hypothetical protein
VAACRDHLKEMLSDKGATRTLVVARSPDSQLTSLALSLLKTVVAN